MKLTTACSPHIRGSFKTSRLMLDVCLALLPALAVGIWRFGTSAVLLTLVCLAAAAATEYLCGLLLYKRNTLPDCSCFVTGFLLAMTLPAATPLWQAAIGVFFAVFVVKGLFGGLGQNVFNPALTGRALLMLLWPLSVTRFAVDGVAGATPLHHMVMPALPEESLLDMFLGNCSGSMGEISALALLLGGVYLVVRKVISARIPLAYIGAVAVLTLVFPKTENAFLWMGYELFSGGLMLGAIFMATDYATSPVTAGGQVIYGIGCGVLTVLFRYFGIYPEGVTYAILLMNACVWVIDRLTPPRRFGTKGGKA